MKTFLLWFKEGMGGATDVVMGTNPKKIPQGDFQVQGAPGGVGGKSIKGEPVKTKRKKK